MLIRPATDADANAIWAIMEPIVRAGETYTLPRNMDERAAVEYWLSAGHEVFVAEENGRIVGTYFLQANQHGGGGHVANCGYITAVNATGRGVARAMQFNFVVSTNNRAVKLWQSFEFQIVGTLPKAFLHPTLGYVDAYIMYRDL